MVFLCVGRDDPARQEAPYGNGGRPQAAPACRKSLFWIFLQAADFFDFIKKVPDYTRKWGLACFSVALLEGIRTATGSPDPLSHFSPVACFTWCHFFDSLKRSQESLGPLSLSKKSKMRQIMRKSLAEFRRPQTTE